VQCLVEIARAPFADAVVFVRRDICAVKRAERRRELHAAGERRAVRGGVAGCAVGGLHQITAAHQLIRSGALSVS
jgi:hypothetical protein